MGLITRDGYGIIKFEEYLIAKQKCQFCANFGLNTLPVGLLSIPRALHFYRQYPLL